MLEALQQEEYQDERAHVTLADEDYEEFVVHPAEDTGVIIDRIQCAVVTFGISRHEFNSRRLFCFNCTGMTTFAE